MSTPVADLINFIDVQLRPFAEGSAASSDVPLSNEVVNTLSTLVRLARSLSPAAMPSGEASTTFELCLCAIEGSVDQFRRRDLRERALRIPDPLRVMPALGNNPVAGLRTILARLPRHTPQQLKRSVLEFLRDKAKGGNKYVQLADISKDLRLDLGDLERSIRLFAGDDLIKLAGAAAKLTDRGWRELEMGKTVEVKPENPVGSYVDPERLHELRGIVNPKFDLTKLVRLCEEVNLCHAHACYLAMAMITRAILDHVPPIFSCGKFSEIANNYGGSKSFKDSMLHLESSSRKIGDQHLHCQIRPSEVLPTLRQVDFSNDLDVLLSEIVRVLK